MRCADVDRLCSGYIDGELDDRRASALRGHLRTCQACLALVEHEAMVRDAAESLDPIEPPPALWSGIEARLAEAEISDANRSRVWFWWQGLSERALPIAVATAAVAVLALWTLRQGDDAPAASVVVASDAKPGADPCDEPHDHATHADTAPTIEFREARRAELARADAGYAEAIGELRELARAGRDAWSAKVVQAFDQRVAEFDVAASEQLAGLAVDTHDPRSRDALYAIYRAEIGFLQRAAMGDLL